MFERDLSSSYILRDEPARVLDGMGMGRGSLEMDGITPSFALNFAEGGSIASQAATPTFTRATTATVVDHDSIVRTALSGEARMQGLRRVQNLQTQSENITLGATYGAVQFGTGSAPVVTTGFTIVYGGKSYPATRLQLALNGGTTVNDRSGISATGTDGTKTRRISLIMQSNTTSNYVVNLRVGGAGGGSQQVTVTPTAQRFTAMSTPDTDGTNWVVIRGGLSPVNSDSADILVSAWQIELVDGQTVTNPAEYVATNVLSAPYYGTNVDGVKYFPTHNGNVVQQNLLVQSESPGTSPWSLSGGFVTATSGQTDPNGGSTATLLTTTDSGGSRALAQVNVFTAANQYVSARFWVKGNGSTTTCNFGLHNGTAFLVHTSKILSGPGSIVGTGNMTLSGLSTTQWTQVEITGLSTNTTTSFFFYPGTSGAAQGMSNFFWHPQVQPGRQGGTYVATTTVAVNNQVVEDGQSDYIPASTRLGYLAEGARTNRCLQSEDFSSASWTNINTPVITANSDVAPDGNTTADTIQDDDAVSAEGRAMTVTVAADTVVRCGSVFVKKDTTTTRFVALHFVVSATRSAVSLNTSTGAISNYIVTAGSSFAGVQDVGNYWRIYCGAANDGVATTAKIEIYPAHGTALGLDNATATGSAVFWGAQIEDGPFPSSYIPTTTVAVSRTDDVLSYPTSGVMSLGTSSGSVFMEYAPNDVTLLTLRRDMWQCTNAVSLNRFELRAPDDNTNRPSFAYGTGTTVPDVISGVAMARGVASKIACAYGAAGGVLYHNGTAATPDVTPSNLGTQAAMGVLTPPYGCVRQVKIWTMRLTDAQLKKLTA